VADLPAGTVALATADWHLPPRRGAWAALPNLADDAHVALEGAVSLTAEAGVPLLAAGDMFDGPRVDARRLGQVGEILPVLPGRRVQLLYVLGNHDADQDWLWPVGLRGVLKLEVVAAATGWPYRDANGYAYIGRGWRADPSDLAAGVPAADAGPYHQHQPWADLLPQVAGPLSVWRGSPAMGDPFLAGGGGGR
jgi:hypothetical protein